MPNLEGLADEVARLEHEITDAIFDMVRAQMREDNEGAKELERRLAKVRRSLQKAEALLRGVESN
jgi:hypothetical protein